jgi:hypothetical protein
VRVTIDELAAAKVEVEHPFVQSARIREGGERVRLGDEDERNPGELVLEEPDLVQTRERPGPAPIGKRDAEHERGLGHSTDGARKVDRHLADVGVVGNVRLLDSPRGGVAARARKPSAQWVTANREHECVGVRLLPFDPRRLDERHPA